MKIAPAVMAFALAFAAAPTMSIAQSSKAAIGALFDFENNKVTVIELLPGGTGDLMGVRPGDVVTHAGDRRIKTQTHLTAWISNLEVGDPVQLTVTRGGKSLQLTGKAMARQR